MACTSLKTAARPKHHDVVKGIGDIQSTSRVASTEHEHELIINSSGFPMAGSRRVAEPALIEARHVMSSADVLSNGPEAAMSQGCGYQIV
jgi:hypothetical protein